MSRETPLAQLAALAARESSGEFICAAPSVEVHVYLQAGRVAWATTSTQPLEFVRYVKEHSRIDDATFRQVVDECRRAKLPLGETLVAWNLVTLDEVRAALRHQIVPALEDLGREPVARTLFLERTQFTRYNAELTLDFAAVAPKVPGQSAPPPATLPSAARRSGFAQQLLRSIEGASWVEVFDRASLVEAAPPTAAPARAPELLVDCMRGGDTDFVAVRSVRGSIVGARIPDGRTLWCKLAADSTFGAAVSTIWSVAGPPPASRQVLARGPATEDWTIGRAGTEAWSELRTLLDRAPEVCAAVLSSDGEPVVGIARKREPTEACLALLRAREKLFGIEWHEDPDEPESGVRLDASGFGRETIVTGEPDHWCFGAELHSATRAKLWVLTDRAASQGVGWACLTALTRGLSRVDLGIEARA